MRFVSLCCAVALVASVSPAAAGTINYTDGQGVWRASSCVLPPEPASVVSNPNAAAEDLNVRLVQQRKYVADIQEYMECVSREAQVDADAAAQLIVRSAEDTIQRAQNLANTSSSAYSRRPVASSTAVAAPILPLAQASTQTQAPAPVVAPTLAPVVAPTTPVVAPTPTPASVPAQAAATPAPTSGGVLTPPSMTEGSSEKPASTESALTK